MDELDLLEDEAPDPLFADIVAVAVTVTVLRLLVDEEEGAVNCSGCDVEDEENPGTCTLVGGLEGAAGAVLLSTDGTT